MQMSKWRPASPQPARTHAHYAGMILARFLIAPFLLMAALILLVLIPVEMYFRFLFRGAPLPNKQRNKPAKPPKL